MRIVAALGGNALLRRGEPASAANQRRNVATAAAALAPLADAHELVITHGNGPQVGLLALQDAAAGATAPYPLDVLDAETEGMIGYLIEQELGNRLAEGRSCATLLTRVEVDAADPAFARPDKPVGTVYARPEAERLAHERGWTVAQDGEGWRRVVASPRPKAIPGLPAIRLLLTHGLVTICAGGGGIPVVRRAAGGFAGVEAVIDKDLTSALLARELGATRLLLLTDVDAVYTDWETPRPRPLRSAGPDALAAFDFVPGSMGPKVAAACEFAAAGGIACIGRLEDAAALLAGAAGTQVSSDAGEPAWRP